MSIRPSAVAALLVVISAGQASAEEIDLRPRFTPTPASYLEIEQNSTQKLEGGPFPAGSTNTSSFVYGLIQQNGGSPDKPQVRHVFDRVVARFDSLAGKMSYDSSAAPVTEGLSTQLAAIFKVWPGQALTVEIGPDGLDGELKGFDELSGAMEASAKNIPLYARMKADITASNLCEVLHNARFAPLPGRQVKLGEQWSKSRTIDSSLFGELTTSYECRLEKVEPENGRRLAVIQYTSVTKDADGAPPPEASNGMKPALVSWSSTGTLKVDVETAEPVSQQQTSNVQYDIELPARGAEGPSTLHVRSENEYHAVVRPRQADGAPDKSESRPASASGPSTP